MTDPRTADGGGEAPDSGSGPQGPSRPDPFQILLAEHEILRRQLDRARQEPADPAGRKVASLVASLRVHMEREEEVLYPVCERCFDGRHGATAVMRDDHAAMIADLRSLTASRDGPGRQVSLASLLTHLEAHFLKEERVLFPLLAARVSNAEAASLVRRMRAARRPDE